MPLETSEKRTPSRWLTTTVLGIILATFFSDVSHEMCTAVLPMYLTTVGLGPAALGVIEGLADFLVSISKLLGGYVGHRVRRKRPWATLGYLMTTFGTWGIAFAGSLAAIVTLRGTAWVGRGFRSPLRDYLLADSVEPAYYGRAYGLERTGDMLGAVLGPLIAMLLIWGGWSFQSIIFWTVLPGLIAAGAFFFLIRERVKATGTHDAGQTQNVNAPFPRVFWLFLIGVFLFGMGDFSRTFLVWLAARSLGQDGSIVTGTLSLAVLLYLAHNLVSAIAAYPVGQAGDRGSKMAILIFGYSLGIVTNLLLAWHHASFGWLIVAIILSGVYIAVEETLEKAVAAQMLPRSKRSLGFGILACGNAVGDMLSSLYVGLLLEMNLAFWAFACAAAFGALGVLWLLLAPRLFLSSKSNQAAREHWRS